MCSDLMALMRHPRQLPRCDLSYRTSHQGGDQECRPLSSAAHSWLHGCPSELYGAGLPVFGRFSLLLCFCVTICGSVARLALLCRCLVSVCGRAGGHRYLPRPGRRRDRTFSLGVNIRHKISSSLRLGCGGKNRNSPEITCEILVLPLGFYLKLPGEKIQRR